MLSYIFNVLFLGTHAIYVQNLLIYTVYSVHTASLLQILEIGWFDVTHKSFCTLVVMCRD